MSSIFRLTAAAFVMGLMLLCGDPPGRCSGTGLASVPWPGRR